MTKKSLRDALLEAAKTAEQRVTIKGLVLVVRQLPTAADTEALRDGVDSLYKFMVRCTFDEAGAPVFSDDDIPALKATAKAVMAPLIKAVADVNGFNVEEQEKNSEASPAGG